MLPSISALKILNTVITTKTLYDTSLLVYNSFGSNNNISYTEATSFLEELDIQTDLNIIESLIFDIEKYKKTDDKQNNKQSNTDIIVEKLSKLYLETQKVKAIECINYDDNSIIHIGNNNDFVIEQDDIDSSFILVTEKDAEPESVINITVRSLKEIYTKTKNTHKIMTDKLDEHIQKYFSSYRALDVKNEMTLLKKYKTIITSRLQKLLDILKIYTQKS